MRLFLTSSGFPEENRKLREEFFHLINKNPEMIKLAFVPTASSLEEDRSFMLAAKKELEGLGILAGNIIDLNLDRQVSFEELKNFDVIFVDGGNTFYLLEKTRKSGFDLAIKEYLEKDLGAYVRVSAGTILAGPNIEIAEPWDDKSIINLEDTKGLGLIDVAYSPHYVEAEEKILKPYKEKADYKIEELRDGEAAVFDNGNFLFISYEKID